MSRNGIEPCEKSINAGTECMCGLLPEGLPEIDHEDGVDPNKPCRLCTGISDQYRYTLTRYGQRWGIVICGVCGTICNEY